MDFKSVINSNNSNIKVVRTARNERKPIDVDHLINAFNVNPMTEQHLLWKIYVQQHQLLHYKFNAYSEGLVKINASIARDQQEIAKAVVNYVENGFSEQDAAKKAELNFPELDLNVQLKAKYTTIIEEIVKNPVALANQTGAPPVYGSEHQAQLEMLYKRMASMISEIKKLKGESRKKIRNQLCSQILAFSQSYKIFTEGYSNITLTGKAGIGKTTTAKIIANVYKHLGVLVYGDLIDTNPSNFIAGYIGQTAIKTNGVLSKSLENVLLIDEAYSLTSCDVKKGELSSGKGFGDEAITQIVHFLSNHRGQCIVMVAGYENAIKGCFLAANEGLPRRFPVQIELPDYSALDLAEIFYDMVNRSTAPKTYFAESVQKQYIYIVVNWLWKHNMLPNQAGDIENLSKRFISNLYTIVALTPYTTEVLKDALVTTVYDITGVQISLVEEDNGRPMDVDIQYNIIDSKCSTGRQNQDIALDQLIARGGLIYVPNRGPFKPVKQLGQGSYGTVWEYSDGTSSIAIKTFNNKDDNELYIVRQKETPCHIVNARVVSDVIVPGSTELQDVVVMNLMSGALSVFVRELGKDMRHITATSIMMILAKTALCLRQSDLIYTDYKLENLLYKCMPDDQVEIVYSDLGSLIPVSNVPVQLVCTYPPWDTKPDPSGIAVGLANSKVMVWGLGICYVSLYTHLAPDEVSYFLSLAGWNQIHTVDLQTLHQALSDVIAALNLHDVHANNNVSVGQLIRMMLHPDPNTRISLNDLVNILT